MAEEAMQVEPEIERQYFLNQERLTAITKSRHNQIIETINRITLNTEICVYCQGLKKQSYDRILDYFNGFR